MLSSLVGLDIAVLFLWLHKLNSKETTGNPVNFQLFAGKTAINCTNGFKTHEIKTLS